MTTETGEWDDYLEFYQKTAFTPMFYLYFTSEGQMLVQHNTVQTKGNYLRIRSEKLI